MDAPKPGWLIGLAKLPQLRGPAFLDNRYFLGKVRADLEVRW